MCPIDENENSGTVGNAAAMREALECAKKKALYISKNYTTPNSLTGNILELLAHLNYALSAPPRNCDVGTAEEQAERQHRFCMAHHCVADCPAWRDGQAHNGCVLVWAQMPYAQEGGAAQ